MSATIFREKMVSLLLRRLCNRYKTITATRGIMMVTTNWNGQKNYIIQPQRYMTSSINPALPYEAKISALLSDDEKTSRDKMVNELLVAWIEENIDKVNQPGTTIDWEDILKRVTETCNYIDKKSFGGRFLSVCIFCGRERKNCFALAQEYMKMVGPRANLTEVASFMKLCGDNMDKVTEEFVLDLYEKVQKKTRGLWEHELADKVMYGLLKTSKWRDSLKIHETVKSKGTVTSRILPDIICTAFDHKDVKLGWSLLNAYKNRLPASIFHHWLTNCPETEESALKLLDYCDQYESHPCGEAIKHLQTYFNKVLNYNSRSTVIYKDTFRCRNCGEQLQKTELSEEEFELLQETFMTKVVVSNDIFIVSTPTELENFKQFIDQYGPFDYVVDGLNLAYSDKRKRGHDAGLLDTAVSQFVMEGKKVLVIGRVHMKNWPKSIMKHIGEQAYMFLLDNKSEDDPFMIYAALKSGPECQLISLDFLRNHTFMLDDRAIARLFKRWRWTHQYKYYWDRRNYCNLVPFASLLPVPQKNFNGIYHIPYEINGITSPYEIPSKWMCFTPRK